MAEEVRLTARLNRSVVPAAGQSQVVYVLVEVMPAASMAAMPLPLNVGLVLDKSGSMAGAKIRQVNDYRLEAGSLSLAPAQATESRSRRPGRSAG